MGKRKILIIEDDRDIVEMLEYNLQEEGYQTVSALNGEKGIALAGKERPDLIILDIMLPVMDGFEVCRTLKNDDSVAHIPIIILSAKSQETDKVVGLELGADDYVTKPFSPRELAARVRAILRRLPGERGPSEIICGNLTIDFLKHEASLDEKPLNLTIIEFKLLGVLAREPGRVFSRAELIEKALGYDFDGFDRTIDVHILNLRRKLEPDPKHPKYIQTIPGVGYHLSLVY